MRFPTSFPGFIQENGRMRAITIDDVSISGAHILASYELLVGSNVTLVAKEIRVSAKIVRSTARGYGLRLDEPIQPLRVVRANLKR